MKIFCFETEQKIFIINIVYVSFVYCKNVSTTSMLISHFYRILFIFKDILKAFYDVLNETSNNLVGYH